MTSSQQNNSTEAVMIEIQNQLRVRIDDHARLTADTNITRDLGLDSLAIMDFIFDLEDSFDISIPMERIAEVQTLADLARAIQVLRKEAA
jgi:acyl carrier protein